MASVGTVLPVYAPGPEKSPSPPEGAAAGGGEGSGETLSASRTTAGQGAHG